MGRIQVCQWAFIAPLDLLTQVQIYHWALIALLNSDPDTSVGLNCPAGSMSESLTNITITQVVAQVATKLSVQIVQVYQVVDPVVVRFLKSWTQLWSLSFVQTQVVYPEYSSRGPNT